MRSRINKIEVRKDHTLKIYKSAIIPKFKQQLWEMIIKWVRDCGCYDDIQLSCNEHIPNKMTVHVPNGEWIEYVDYYVLYLTVMEEFLEISEIRSSDEDIFG